MKRREFLSATGAIVGGLGLSQSRLLGWQQALADPSRRKLALLIGINQYPNATLGQGLKSLQGCLTDIELQRQLLLHRFGFDASNLVTLVDGQATQSAILEALYQLTQTASANDCVVVHFSGYGGQVEIAGKRIKTWVPVDGYLPTATESMSRDVPVSWVKQILARLKTKQLFTVIDAGYSRPDVPLSSGYNSRARWHMPVVEAFHFPDVSDALAADVSKVQTSTEPAFFPGDLLMAARDGQPVIERQWTDFGAGLFTYGLTRYLWAAQLPTKLSAAMRGAQESLLPIVPNQTPSWTTQTADEHTLYGDTDLPCLDAVLTSVEGRSANLWLGGLPADVVQYSERFSFGRQPDGDASPVVMRSQSGLTGRFKLPDGETWPVGQPLYEVMRVLPKTLPLTVSIDSNLERIERVDATSALAALSFVESTDDSRPADCMLGKFQTDEASDSDTPTATQVYGLFTPTRALISGSLAKQDEAVKMAVSRLSPKLETILAMKLLRLSENQASSHLAIRLNLLVVGETEKLAVQQETRRATGQASKSRLADAVSRQNYPVEFSKGVQVRYQALNFGADPVYVMLLGFDARDRMLAFFPPSDGQPYSMESLQAAMTLAPGTALSLPNQNTWVVDDTEGRVETYLVCSTSPLLNCWQELLSVANSASNQRVTLGENALPLVQALLKDLSSHAAADDAGSYTLHTAHWATLGCHYRIA
ncbi:caspase family protein [Leptolyngbya cf. ectocarpi LEGE 11479]|uniref:Caspase family protein n=1 Tax=Leptolyngbya cf. ectocarpi LEGE 11479 TaxID=1828722 RepID=A0A928X2K0_LEPEC|nr:caspase family protein [Leptolyngbya ectocarpi]MBE9065363.1 caspase family protein [Leptolyngbya cf. ectocarpi LEGE 11479]